MSKRAFTLVELLVVIAIIALLLSILVPTLNRVREQTRRVVCASNLKQIGLLLEYYCADNEGYYPPNYYSGGYMYKADPRYPEQQGLIGLFPYLFKGGSLSELKHRSDLPRMNIFWCPSGTRKWSEERWSGSAFGTFGYLQYCGRADMWLDGYVGSKPMRDFNNHLEHCSVKNTPHISNGKKFNPGWLTVTDVAFEGWPVNTSTLRSNHSTTKTVGRMTRERITACGGSNALCAGGNVKWNDKVVMNDDEKLVKVWIYLKFAITYREPSYWLFPRTP
ncbi:MAG: prepilin-type N-terminal cleavage/methylation domain-containing protein [Planctomycetota bacterium]